MQAQPLDGERSLRAGNRLVRFVERWFIWFLVACYVLAGIWPRPGLALRQWEWSPAILADQPLTLSLLLLAVMLFIAATLTDVRQIRSVLQNPLLLGAALSAVWLGPALLVVVAGWIIPWAIDGQASVGLLVGLALIAAMPVANSSVGWIQSADGNLAMGLALVVISISLSPWLTPLLLSWLGMSLSAAEQDYCEQLVNKFSGWFFVVWVLLPTAAGFLCRLIVTPRRVNGVRSWLTLTSVAALLLLNYVNSALALPRVRDASAAVLAATAVLAAALSIVGIGCAWLLARMLRQPHDTRSALMFGLSMKHTGLALILASVVLHGQPLAILMIVVATLMQHFAAGLIQWGFLRGAALPRADST